MQRILLPVVAALGLATGCYTQGDVGVGYSYGYAAPAPSMYYMDNGVSVVAYSDYPVFYSDNYYWRYDNGLWYRSNYHGGGWVVWHDVPYRVRSIDRPYRYARYDGRWSRQPAYRPGYQRGGNVRDQRTYRGGYQQQPARPAVRDHRGPATYRAQPAAPAPAVRDHRAPARNAPARAPARPAPAVRDHRRR